MSAKSSTDRYGTVAAGIHWLTALAVIFMLGSGQTMDFNPGAAPSILPFHVAFGVAVGALTLFRIVWWLAVDRFPRPMDGTSRVQRGLARSVHLALYAALLIMVATGIATIALTGAAPAIFGGGKLPDFSAVPPFMAHGAVSKLLLVLALGHIGAALWHHYIRRDGLIGRILPLRG
jgi:cytochrome b561